MTKAVALLLLVVVVMAVVAMPTEARIRGRKKGCTSRSGRAGYCNSNVSFFKRLLEEYRNITSDAAPDGDDLATREGADDKLGTKILLLRELLAELQAEDDDTGL
ncbi:uncharacterized protein LOC110975566 [Acanthaster planci]|uniref:Uncharacterized protein LOC110975566 n=1 Tax=Acanthaster planci TaxID=133434 RepID=A0A8B7XSK0_ACAPL|nr:uncharacterized protein LOC110975566 [Acanthaster planci]